MVLRSRQHLAPVCGAALLAFGCSSTSVTGEEFDGRRSSDEEPDGGQVSGDGDGDGDGNGDNACGGESCDGGSPSEPEPQACTRDSDCNDDLACNGEETCVDNVCEAGDSPCNNDDPDHCAIDCNEGDDGPECAVVALDADDDGHGTEACNEAPGDDCDDGNDAVYLGAEEVCDGVDNDCNGLADLEDGLEAWGTTTTTVLSNSPTEVYAAWSPEDHLYAICRTWPGNFTDFTFYSAEGGLRGPAPTTSSDCANLSWGGG